MVVPDFYLEILPLCAATQSDLVSCLVFIGVILMREFRAYVLRKENHKSKVSTQIYLFVVVHLHYPSQHYLPSLIRFIWFHILGCNKRGVVREGGDCPPLTCKAHLECCAWGLQYGKDVELLERVHRATKRAGAPLL